MRMEAEFSNKVSYYAMQEMVERARKEGRDSVPFVQKLSVDIDLYNLVLLEHGTMTDTQKIDLIKFLQGQTKDISILDLSVRSYNCLKRVNIDTVGQLVELSEMELRGVRNLGMRGVEEVIQKLTEYVKEGGLV